AFPKASVTLLGGSAAAELLQGCPYVDAVWGDNPKLGPLWGGTRRLIRRTREGRFDAVFLLNRSLHSALMAFAARIPIRIGHATEHRGGFLTHRARYDWSKRDLDCSLDLLRTVGIPAEFA